jgi:hypothetical protein
MGAGKTITIDLNPYLKAELVCECLQYMADNESQIRQLFGAELIERNLVELLALPRTCDFDLRAFLALCNIEYIAPGDAARTGLPCDSVDYFTSYTVFEHIPPPVLKGIVEEGNRITRFNGLFVHKIDYSDHFSHSDRSISPINFLQYSDSEWEKYAGNRYMYMNRMRHDDYLCLFESLGQCIVATEPDIDEHSIDLLKRGIIKVDKRFQDFSNDALGITDSWIISRKCG